MAEEFREELIRKLKEKSEYGLLRTERDPQVFDVLSPDCINVLEWYPFRKEASVFQYGSSDGAFLPLAERVSSWEVCDPLGTGLLTARMEAAGRDGIRFPVTVVKEEPAEHRDLLILCKWPGKGKAEELIEKLTPERTLILSENKNALRFFTGAAKDEETRYVTAEELRELGEGKLYFPLPSLNHAKDVKSEELPPLPGDFRGVSDSEGVSLTGDLEALYDSLCGESEKAIFTYAPAFLYVLGKDTSLLPDYIRYNRQRKPAFRIRTELWKGKEVRKTALTKEADEHIRLFETRCRLLQETSPLSVTVPVLEEEETGRVSAVFPYVSGKSLGTYLAGLIKDGKAPAEEMEKCLARMTGDGSQPLYNKDLLFDNVLADGDTWHLIDYEWVEDKPLPARFVRYRTLRYFYEDNAQSLYGCKNLAEFLNAFGFVREEQMELEQMEEKFQLYVHGEDKGGFENHFKKEPVSVGMIREQARKACADEIDSLRAALIKEREVERLSQQHIRNIERMNEEKEDRIRALTEENAWLYGHMSIFNRAKRKFIGKLDAWAPAGSRKRLLIKYAKGTVKHPGTYLKRYFTKEGHDFIRGNFRILGEFSEGGILTLPACDRPLVSIVIPAFNQVTYTYACIRSVLEHTDAEKTPYEVILADDASTDATGDISLWVKNLIVSRTGGNLGFLRNCNNAALHAKGDYLFFLNNDTKVTEGWLSSLVKLMEEDPSIGLCGSKLVFPDGKLQEAGGIIWRDGSGWNYGRGDDPGKCAYNYVKDVDYISGAAILVRRSLWEEIGGFDERFAPAYCEDSDLAFEVRKHGYRVVYQPLSTVIHFEGISNGTDVEGSGLKRYQLVNQEKFREKWAAELQSQEENTGNPNPFAARERSGGKKTVLVIDHAVPMWDKDAGSRTTCQYLKMLVEKGYNVKLLGDDFRRPEPYTTVLSQMGIEVLYGGEMQGDIYNWILRNRAYLDIAYLNRPHIAVKYIDFLRENTKAKCIFYGHDLHYLRLLREYELTGDMEKKRESDYWKGVEYQVMGKADAVYYPSEEEIREIRARRPEINAKAITAYIYDKEAVPPPVEKHSGLLFVGGFKHPPNEDGVLWFARDIWPLIRKDLPDCVFRVAGSHPTEEVLSLNGKDGIEVLGFVTDEELAYRYEEALLTVVPLRYGAGVKGKVVEALHLGAAVVTTSIGAEGIPEADTAMAVSDTPAGFAEEVIRLYRDEGARNALKEATQPLIGKYYSTSAAWSVIQDDFS